jgi:pilus assembly protein TadC
MGEHESDIHGAQESSSQLSPTHLTVVGILGGALIGWTVLGIFGALIGAGTALWLLRLWKKREEQPQRKYIDALTRDSPVMIDLLCAALSSGATMRDSLAVVRDSMSESPVAQVLSRVVSAVDLGADPKEAWTEWTRDPVLGRLAHTIARSHDSGAGLVDVLEGASRELRREHRRRVETAARGAGVQAVIPLAVCFLPAFFALGVVPIVASLASSTDFFGL